MIRVVVSGGNGHVADVVGGGKGPTDFGVSVLGTMQTAVLGVVTTSKRDTFRRTGACMGEFGVTDTSGCRTNGGIIIELGMGSTRRSGSSFACFSFFLFNKNKNKI